MLNEGEPANALLALAHQKNMQTTDVSGEDDKSNSLWHIPQGSQGKFVKRGPQQLSDLGSALLLSAQPLEKVKPTDAECMANHVDLRTDPLHIIRQTEG